MRILPPEGNEKMGRIVNGIKPIERLLKTIFYLESDMPKSAKLFVAKDCNDWK